jgi:nicotinamide-nucleotide amidase
MRIPAQPSPDPSLPGAGPAAGLFDAALLALAEEVLGACRAAGLMVATAESCTGGLVAAALTAIAGSSDVVERGFVTYSNLAKTELLGVPAELIASAGAVSEAVARAMAEGALAHSIAALAVSVTGIAGPEGGSAEKPVGLVWFGLARRGAPTQALRQMFPGDRAAVRLASVLAALDLLKRGAAAA